MARPKSKVFDLFMKCNSDDGDELRVRIPLSRQVFEQINSFFMEHGTNHTLVDWVSEKRPSGRVYFIPFRV
jgi:succinylarginine dihydrolase